jgi:beta-fructofuranosidase
MESTTLREARKFEEIKEKTIGETDRPAFHLTPRVGWMNDPNGFSYYKGAYHMFYQYHPYECFWGPMHWGHAVSSDLLHWKFLPAALAPDMPYDMDGCFSGSAITLPDGNQLLMYTGVRKEPKPDGGIREVQTQCLAVGDGTDYEKYQNNPVLTAKDIPEGGDPYNFRDPKIWRGGDGIYRCAVGNYTSDDDGSILLYRSEDCYHWTYVKKLAVNGHRLGKMWECPDFFALDGKQVLLVSPQFMEPEGFEYHNGNGTVCVIGTYDEEREEFVEECNHAVDYGIDFYAPQTILTPDGRRVMIGWMQNWDTSSQHDPTEPWFGQMSIPRELCIRNHRLCQQPVRELEQMRKNEVKYENIQVSGEIILEGIRGRLVDLELSVRPADAAQMYHRFAICVAKGGKYFTSISVNPYDSTVKVDRKFSGSRRAVIHQRRSYVESCRTGEIRMRIILDRFSAEVFLNDGEQSMSAVINTVMTADEISFWADGQVLIDVIKYDLIG